MNTILIGGRIRLDPYEIVLAKAEINYSTVHYADGRKFFVATTLKILEDRLLPFKFCRTHRSYLINLDHIKKFKETGFTIRMKDNNVAKISRRKKENLLKTLNIL